MKTTCPFCNQAYKVDPEWLDKKTTCSKCGNEFVIKEDKPLTTSFCPFCHQKYKVGPEWLNQETYCVKCGKNFKITQEGNEQESNIIFDDLPDDDTQGSFDDNDDSWKNKIPFWLFAILNAGWLLFGLGYLFVPTFKQVRPLGEGILATILSYAIYIAGNAVFIKLCKIFSESLTASVLYLVYRVMFFSITFGEILIILGHLTNLVSFAILPLELTIYNLLLVLPFKLFCMACNPEEE